MVARLIRLRLALTVSVFRGGLRRVAKALLIGVIGIAVAIGLAWFPLVIAKSSIGRSTVDILTVSVLLIAIACVPLFANLGNLEPRQFAALPTSAAQVATAMLVSTVFSWPMLWLLVWMGVLGVLRPAWQIALWAEVVGAVLTLLMTMLFVRVGSALVRLFVPRRAVSSLRWIGLLLLSAALPVVVFMLAQAFSRPGSTLVRDAAGVMGWTPFGSSVMGVELAKLGDADGALAHFAVSAGTVLLLLLVWYWLVARSVRSIEKPVAAGEANDGLELFARFPARPRAVIAARMLIYWRRDPRYWVALVAVPFAPIVMIVALYVAGVDWSAIALVPLPVVLLLLGWSVHNDVAFDSTAIWMHVASGTRGSHDRAGRLTPVLLFGLPLVVIGSSLSVTFSGDWRVLPAVLGMNIGVLLSASASSSVFSSLMPYPATRPGDSPFAQPAVIQGSGSGLAQTLSMLIAIVLSVPPIAAATYAIINPTFEWNIAVLLFGVAWGVVVAAFGIWLGGKVFDRRAPELVALTQMYD